MYFFILICHGQQVSVLGRALDPYPAIFRFYQIKWTIRIKYSAP